MAEIEQNRGSIPNNIWEGLPEPDQIYASKTSTRSKMNGPCQAIDSYF